MTEFDYHELFKKWCEKTGRYKVIERSHDSHNIPDAWVEDDGVQMPVEVKKNNFDAKALEQLQRYMRVYKRSHGLAVARKCTVNLPYNIEFVSLDDVESVVGTLTEKQRKAVYNYFDSAEKAEKCLGFLEIVNKLTDDECKKVIYTLLAGDVLTGKARQECEKWLALSILSENYGIDEGSIADILKSVSRCTKKAEQCQSFVHGMIRGTVMAMSADTCVNSGFQKERS